MCVFGQPKMTAAPIIAADTTREQERAATIEAELRRRRAGAAANILTSPLGIPASVGQLGKVKA